MSLINLTTVSIYKRFPECSDLIIFSFNFLSFNRISFDYVLIEKDNFFFISIFFKMTYNSTNNE